jgi:MFS family permease
MTNQTRPEPPIQVPMPTGFRTLWRSNPAWRKLIMATAISSPGDLMYTVALSAELLDRTNSPSWVAAGVFARPFARMVFGPIGGDIADRFPRRKVLVIGDFVRALIMFVLCAFVAVKAPPAVLIAVVALASIASAPYMATFSAMVGEFVADDDLDTANSGEISVQQSGWFLGAALGALIARYTSPAVAIALNGITFAAAAFVVAQLPDRFGSADSSDEANSANSPDRSEPIADTTRTSPLASTQSDDKRNDLGTVTRLVESVRLIRCSPILSGLTLLLAAMMFTFGAEGVLTVLIAERRLGLGGSGAGYLVAAAGIGAIGAPWIVPRILKSTSLALGVAGATLMQALPLFVLTLTKLPTVAVGAMVLEGVGAALFETATSSTVQRTTPTESIGRIFGLFGSLAAAAELLGAAVAPLCLFAFALPTVTMGLAITVLTLGVAAGIILTRRATDLQPAAT